MPEPIPFESREAQLDQAIADQTEQYRKGGTTTLPQAGDPIVTAYVGKIEGRYDVDRAKLDTDNTNALLYIAYNTTPQDCGELRIAISDIMDKLIRTQQDSEIAMKEARRTAEGIIGEIEGDGIFADWMDVKGDPADQLADSVKHFLGGDLQDLARRIQAKAKAVRDKLVTISDRYDTIIADTQKATSSAEAALGTRIAKAAELAKEINEADAERKRLDSLVEDMREQVKKYDAMAKDFASRAETAEERSFVMSIVRIGCETLSALLGPLALIAAGPGSMLAAAAGGSAKSAAAKSAEGDDASDDDTQAVIQKKTELSEQKKKLADEETKKSDLEAKLDELETTRAKLPKVEDAEDVPADAKALDERIDKTKAEIVDSKNNINALSAAITGLQSALEKLSGSLRELSAEQKSEATSLRDMQMKMLDKVEEYENARRDQSAELAKITALLAGKRSVEESAQLAVKSLNVSISALKRSKEIVVEMAAFFKTFADFIGSVAQQAKEREDRIAGLIEKPTIRDNALKAAIQATDVFLIQQVAEWRAVAIVSDKFIRNFADGWSQLNTLNGTYITGEKLAEYLEGAKARMTEIVEDRNRASKARIASLDEYRKQLEAQKAA